MDEDGGATEARDGAAGEALPPVSGRTWRGLALCVLLFGVLFGSLRVLRMRSFFSYEWEDEALHVQVMWNTVHGRPFQQTLWPQKYELHLRPVLFLLAPLCAPRPRLETLYYLYSLLLGAGAFGVFLYARLAFRDEKAGLLAAAGYLLYPPLHFVAWSTLDSATLAAPLICLGVYAVEGRRLGLFHLALLLIAGCKEDLAATSMMLGVYAGLRGRGAWWWAPYLVLAPVYVLLALHVVFPAWAAGGSFWPASRLVTSWGKLRAVDPNVATALFKLAAQDGKWQAALLLLGPLAFLPVLRPLLLVPGLVALWQVWFLNFRFGSAQGHHLTPLVAAAFLAGATGARAAADFAFRCGWAGGLSRGGLRRRTLTALVCVLAVANAAPNRLGASNPETAVDRERSHIVNIFHPILYRRTDDDRAALEMIRKVPERVPVAATAHLLPWLAGRPFVASFPAKQRAEEVMRKAEYIVVDKRLKMAGAGSYPAMSLAPGLNARLLDQAKQFALQDGKYELAAEKGACFLLKKTGRGAAGRGE